MEKDCRSGERHVDPVDDHFFDRAAARALEYGRLEGAARLELSALRLLPSHRERLRAVTSAATSPANPALVELLLEEGRSCVHDSPWEARELAELAEAVALRLPAEIYGRGFCEDRLTEAWAHRGNALRAQGDLKQAEVFLAKVSRRLHETFDPFLQAEAASFAASLAKDQRRFHEALERLDEAERLFEEVDASFDLVARVRLQRASVLAHQGDAESAIALVGGLIDRLAEEDEPELRFMARHNLVSYLCDAGRYREARALLAEMEGLYARHRRRSFRIRFQWRQGKIAHGLGEHEAAERAYVRARDAFLVAGLGYDASLVVLDLATLYLGQGRNAEVREAALWTSTLFDSYDVHREALAALALFRQAALEDALSVAQLRQLTRHVASLRTGATLEPVS